MHLVSFHSLPTLQRPVVLMDNVECTAAGVQCAKVQCLPIRVNFNGTPACCTRARPVQLAQDVLQFREGMGRVATAEQVG